MANRVDPDQTAPSGAVWSGSALFAYAIMSKILVYEILGHLPYFHDLARWIACKNVQVDSGLFCLHMPHGAIHVMISTYAQKITSCLILSETTIGPQSTAIV